MSYKALYRTYRPQAFEDVAGQKHIVKTLQNAFNENKIAHAYLFCGPRGTGKTTMARLFAKALNCEEGFGFQCNECANCKAISEGSHPDVIEIDAASNRGIDDIRDIIAKVKYSPIRGKWKIYIIDEVHMMTTEAFNALLKTLEEPPENVVFILCTTEPFKLMPTILSRVQRYDFTKISSQDLLENLKKVCSQEGVEADEEALEVIVSLSDGGGRDSLSMLDQAIAYSSKRLELHHVQELFGLSTIQEKLVLIKAMNDKDILTLTTKFDELCSHGSDIKRLTFDLIEIIKDLLIYKTTKDASILKVLKEKDAQEYAYDKDKLIFMLDTLMNAYSQFRLVSDIRSIVEISFLKIASFDSISNGEERVVVKEVVKEVIKEVPVIKEVVKEVPTPVVQERVVTPIIQEVKPTPKVTPAPIEVKEKKETNIFVETGTPIEISDDQILNIMLQASKSMKLDLIDKWNSLVNLLGDPELGKYAQILRNTTPKVMSENSIILETKFAHVVQKISFKENQAGLQEVIKHLTGKKYYVLCVTQEKMLERVSKFSFLMQVKKLPEPYPVSFDFTYEEVKQETMKEKSETEKFVEDLNK